MTQAQSITAVLKDLKEITGVTLQLDPSQSEDLEHAVAQLHRLCNAYHEKYNRSHFLQSLLYSSNSAYEINEQATKLHIKPEELRVFFLLETAEQSDDTLLTVLQSLFPSRTGAYVFPANQNQIVILHPFTESPSAKRLERLAHSMVDTLNAEALVSVKATYSAPFQGLTSLSELYQNACLSLKIGQLFASGKTVFSCDHLGVGGLIYQLPKEACDRFLNEVFRNDIPDTLDFELVSTINRFFMNNLNIAETARQLHMHRNTLIYRLEQIQKKTDLDLRNFEDALTFKIALMVMNFKNTN